MYHFKNTFFNALLPNLYHRQEMPPSTGLIGLRMCILMVSLAVCGCGYLLLRSSLQNLKAAPLHHEAAFAASFSLVTTSISCFLRTAS